MIIFARGILNNELRSEQPYKDNPLLTYLGESTLQITGEKGLHYLGTMLVNSGSTSYFPFRRQRKLGILTVV